jgi:myo-inositol-1(or 4)-monophosphatase
MHVSGIRDMSRAVLATGFPLLSDVSPESVQWFLDFAGKFKKVRMLGTAALSLAWVAEGRMDAYFERDIMVWDVAAGAALVRGAGGKCIMRPGRYPMSLDVLAANKGLAERMEAVLKW